MHIVNLTTSDLCLSVAPLADMSSADTASVVVTVAALLPGSKQRRL